MKRETRTLVFKLFDHHDNYQPVINKSSMSTDHSIFINMEAVTNMGFYQNGDVFINIDGEFFNNSVIIIIYTFIEIHGPDFICEIYYEGYVVYMLESPHQDFMNKFEDWVSDIIKNEDEQKYLNNPIGVYVNKRNDILNKFGRTGGYCYGIPDCTKCPLNVILSQSTNSNISRCYHAEPIYLYEFIKFVMDYDMGEKIN